VYFASHMKRSCHALAGALATCGDRRVDEPRAFASIDSPRLNATGRRRLRPNGGGGRRVGNTAQLSCEQPGVRRAAAEGPEALRRYIWRTRMVYNYYFWDFVKQE